MQLQLDATLLLFCPSSKSVQHNKSRFSEFQNAMWMAISPGVYARYQGNKTEPKYIEKRTKHKLRTLSSPLTTKQTKLLPITIQQTRRC